MIWTNGAYDIEGDVITNNVLKGIVIKTLYPHIYKVGQLVILPYYHTEIDKKNKKPQFYRKIYDKLDCLIKNIE